MRLLRTKGLGNAGAVRLVRRFGSAAAVLAMPTARWGLDGAADEGEAALASESGGATRRSRHALAVPDEDDPRVVLDLDWLDGTPDAHAVPITDPRYPELLRETGNPPLLLFVRGAVGLLAEAQVAVVGARTATPQGLENARAFAASLAARGLVVTSGLALGVDGAAHQGALAGRTHGATIAVVATGLDRVYPARHKALAQAILDAGGALVSEFAPGTESVAAHFPRRNRVIAGLSLGTLVVEASVDSGSLITARMALDAGREVFAIPGSIHNPLARGCHRLIRDGAKLVESVDDVLLELAPRLRAALAAGAAGGEDSEPSAAGQVALSRSKAARPGLRVAPLPSAAVQQTAPVNAARSELSEVEPSKAEPSQASAATRSSALPSPPKPSTTAVPPFPPTLGPAEQTLLAALGDAPQTIDALVTKSGLPAEAVNAALLVLELDGWAAEFQGRYLLARTHNNG